MVEEDLVFDIAAVAVRRSAIASERVLGLLILSVSDDSISDEVCGLGSGGRASALDDDGGGIFPCTTCAAVRRLFTSMPSSLRASLQVRPKCSGLTQYLQVRI